MGAAPIQFSASLKGYEGVVRRFRKLEAGVAGPILRKATRAGVDQQARTAKRTTEFRNRTGLLRRSIGTSVRARQKGQIVSGRVLVRTRFGARYANPLEYGHRIAVNKQTGRAQKNYVLFERRDGKPRKVRAEHKRAVVNGYVAPRPFMRRAFEQSTSQATDAFTRKFTSGVAAEVGSG